MTWNYTPYLLPSLLAAGIAVWSARHAWRNRLGLGSTSFVILTLAVALLALGHALELGAFGLSSKVAWAKFQYLGIAVIPAAWLTLALEQSGRARWITYRNLVLLSLIPLLTLFLVITNDSHHLIWYGIRLDRAGDFFYLTMTSGPWLLVNLVYAYSLLLIGALLQVQIIRQSHLSVFRWQAFVLLLSVLAPWLGNAISVFELSPWPQIDLTFPGLCISGIVVALGILRYRLFDVVPIARRTLVDNFRDGVFVLDLRDRVVDANVAGQRVVGLSLVQLVGRPAIDVFPADLAVKLTGRRPFQPAEQTEIIMPLDDEDRHYDLQVLPLHDDRDQERGRLLIFHDISERKQVEADLRAQKQLFQNLVAVARATTERPTLEATLQSALDVAASLTRAELGSLFLLDESGVVTHSILSRGQTTLVQQQIIVGQVIDKGLAGWVLRHRQPALILDTAQDNRWLVLPDAPYDARSVLAVPILASNPSDLAEAGEGEDKTRSGDRSSSGGGGVLGLLTLQHSQAHHFSAEDFNLIQAAADQMALALHNARIYDKQRQQARRQAILYKTLRTVGNFLEPEPAAQAAVTAITQLTDWLSVAIVIPEPVLDPADEARSLVVLAAGGILASAKGTVLAIDHSICGRAFTSGQTQNVADVAADSDYIRGHKDIQSELAVPLRRGQRILGVLDLESEQRDAFQSEDVRLAESLAEAVALALDNARLFRVVEDERSHLAALIKSSRDGIILVGMDQQVLVMNTPAHDFMRLPGEPADWLNIPLERLVEALDQRAPSAVAIFEPARGSGQETIDRAHEADGRSVREGETDVPPRTIQWLMLPVLAGSSEEGETPIGRLFALRDVTQERSLEQTREDLMHTMVHDLRNPLNNIYGAQELLLDIGQLTHEHEEVLNVARESTQRMRRLVNAILEISRLESGRIEWERVILDLGQIIASTLQNQQLLARKKGISLHQEISEDLPPVWADRELMDRLFQNLVDNAVKFTPSGGRVTITAKRDAQDSQQILVMVRDTGSGIPPDLKERLFQKFATGKQLGSGSGLGLAFCKMVVESHGGRIWVESEPGQGATFFFTLPAAKTDRTDEVSAVFERMA